MLADPSDVRLYTHEASTLDLEGAIAERIGQILEAEKLKAYAIDDLPQIMQSVKTDVTLQAFRIDEEGTGPARACCRWCRPMYSAF